MDLTLAIETSSLEYGIAVGRERALLAHQEFRGDRQPFAGVGELVASALKEADADFPDIGVIAVDVGPGNLSSVRKRVAYANGLAFSLGVPIFCAHSLELLAREALVLRPSCPVLCLRKAEAGNVYAGIFAPGRPQLFCYSALEPAVKELTAGMDELSVAGARGSDVIEILSDRKVHDSAISAPSVLTLYQMAQALAGEAGRMVLTATALNEGSRVFHEQV